MKRTQMTNVKDILRHRYGLDFVARRDCRRGRCECRHGIASQIPTEHWPAVVGEPTIADSIMDRIVHNAYHIELTGESQRKRNTPPPLSGSEA